MPMKFEVWSALDADDLARGQGDPPVSGDQTVKTIVGLPAGARSAATAADRQRNAAHWSDVGRRCSRSTRAPFVGAYYEDADGARRWSLRSRPDFDVSEVAKQLGGGGHRAGVGFREPRRP